MLVSESNINLSQNKKTENKGIGLIGFTCDAPIYIPYKAPITSNKSNSQKSITSAHFIKKESI